MAVRRACLPLALEGAGGVAAVFAGALLLEGGEFFFAGVAFFGWVAFFARRCRVGSSVSSDLASAGVARWPQPTRHTTSRLLSSDIPD